MENALQGWLGVLIIVAIALALASLPFWGSAKPFAPSTTSDKVALSGLVLTLAGFGITIWQLLRTQRASLAAAIAVQGLKHRLETFEDSQLCESALEMISELERWHLIALSKPSREIFLSVGLRYRSLRESLFQLRARLENTWTSPQLTTMQNAVAKLADAEKAVMKWLRPKSVSGPPPNLAPLQEALRGISEMLTTIAVNLNREASGRGK